MTAKQIYGDFEYYFNNVPDVGLCRNNLIYTSLINKDKTVFCQWYYNDSDYHKGQNQVVDQNLMNQKWDRELFFLQMMYKEYPNLVPKILEIDSTNKKIYLEIQGPDFWEQASCKTENFDKILIDWQDQMLDIIKAHQSLNLFKYSMHPSSYFVVDGKLKSINYFFTYGVDEGPIKISDHLSHIYTTRQDEMRKYTDSLGISWNIPQPLDILQQLCWDSFRTNYPESFIEKAKEIGAAGGFEPP